MNEPKTKKPCNLITQTIIEAVNFYDTMGEWPIKKDKVGFEEQAAQGLTWKQYAYNELVAKVNRVKTPFPERAMRGVKFEKAVYKAAESWQDVEGSNEFKTVVREVKGMDFGNKGGINIYIPGVDDICYVYTKEDALKFPLITDLKTTEEYKKPGKYLEGIQHELYCYRWIKTGMDIEEFKYLIAEWDVYPKLKNLYGELFVREDVIDILSSRTHQKVETFNNKDLITTVERKIFDFIARLKELELFEAYQENFCLYPWNGKEVYECDEVKGVDYGF